MRTIPFRFMVLSAVAHGGLLLAPSGDWLPTPPLLLTTPFTVQLGMAPDVGAPSPAQSADRDRSVSDSSPATAVTHPVPANRIVAVIAVTEPQQIGSGREAHIDTSSNIPDTNTGGRTELDIAASQTDIPKRMPAIDEPPQSSAPSPATPPLPVGQGSAPPASKTVAAAAPAEPITTPPTDNAAETDNTERPATAPRVEPVRVATVAPAPVEPITTPATDNHAEADNTEHPATASHVEPVRVATAAPSADPTPTTGAALGAIAARARREISALLALRFRYPALARKHGWQGRVQVRLTLSASGRIDTTQIVQSSGYRVLDRNALKTLRRIGRLPGDAQWLQGHELSLDIPIRYRLING